MREHPKKRSIGGTPPTSAWTERALRALACTIAVVAALAISGSAQAAPTVTTVSNVTTGSGNSVVAAPLTSLTVVLSNNTPSTLNSQYLGFKIANDSTARTDLWITVSNVSGGNATLAPTEDGIAHVGALAANATTHVFFYFRASAVTTTDTTFRINAYEGPPSAGGTAVDLDTASANTWASAAITEVVGTQNASANKVLSGYISPSAPVLGSTFQVVVNGDTGQLKQSGDVVFTPAFAGSWDAGKFELVSTRIRFDADNATYDNQLAFQADTNAGTNKIRKAGQTYSAAYTFRAVDRTSANVKPTPVGALQSGNLLKYTNASSLSLIPPIQPVTNAFVIDARVSPTLSANGRLTYSLTLQNTSTRTLSVDTISDVLPAGTTYQTGTTTGVTTRNPDNSSGTLTWSGPFSVAGGSRVTLSYQAWATPTASSVTYTNRATATVGPTLIDTTLDTTDNQPARATATVNSAFSDDTTAPAVTLTAQDGAGATIANGGSTGSTSATMLFTANESAQFTCSLDGATPTACASPRSLTGLATRLHTFYVYATDAAGNVGTATITWTVTDATKPTVLSFTPVQLTAKTSPIQYNLLFSEDVTGLATGDLSAVTSGSTGTWTVASVVGSGDSYVVTLSSTSPGTSGTVQARLAANAVLDTASPANTGPLATVDSGTVTLRTTLAVEITAAAPAAGATSNATSATFSFAETAASYPASRFQCSMVVTGNAASWSECSSPVSYTGLTSASYTFSLKAEDVTVTVDNSGNETVTLNATSATVTSAWTVDATSPTVAISAPTAAQVVTTATPTISGTCTTGDGVVTVRLYGGSSSTGSALQTLTGTCTAGSWSVTPTELVSAGYTATARQTDAAGNATTTPDRQFTVRTTGPTVSVGVPEALIKTTTSPASGDCTTSQAGRVTSDVEITLTKGATTITATATCGVRAGSLAVESEPGVLAVGDGSYTTNVTGLSDGVYTVRSTQTDTTAGLTGTSLTTTLTVDSTPPAVTITSPATGSRIATTLPTVVGACETASGTVTVSFVAGGTTRTATSTCTDGSYSAKPGLADALADGTTYAVTATQTDTAGNVGTSSSITLIVDTTAPTVTITSPADGSSTTTNPTVTGACESGAGSGDGAVTVTFVTGVTTRTATGVCSGGSYSATPSGANSLSVGTSYTVTAAQTDTAGNTGTSAAITISVTSVAVAVDLANASDSGVSNSDDLTNDTTPTISVSGLGGAAATVRAVQSGSTDVTCSISASGTQCDLGTLANGTWSISATPSGGTPSAAITVRIDTVAPSTTASITAAYTTGTAITVDYTGSDAVGIHSVTAYYSTDSSLASPSSCNTATSSATSGSITCTIPSADATYYVYTLGADAAGNTEAVPGSADDSIVRDTALPAAPTVDLAAASDSGSSSTDDLTNVTSPTITVTGLEGSATSTVTAARNGVADVTCAVTSGSCVLSGLSAGAWTVTATQTDAAGNTSVASTALTVTVDLTDPVSSGTISATVTNGTGVAVAFTAADANGIGGVTAYYSTAESLTSPTSCGTNATGAVTGTISCTIPAVDATYYVYTRATDAAGNVEHEPVAADDSIVRDATPPAAPTVDLAAASDSGFSSTDDVTSATGPTIDVGSIEAGATAVVSAVKGATTATCSVSGAACALSGLTEGVWTVTAKATDEAGNQSTASASPVSVTVDTTAPDSTGSIVAARTSGTSVSVAYSATEAVGLRSVTAYHSTSAGLSSPVSCGSVTSTSLTGTITCTIPATDGTYHVYTRATDSAGNVEDAPGTADDTIERDATAPAAPTVNLADASDSGWSNADDNTADATPTIEVTGIEAGATSTVTATRSGASDVTCTVSSGSCDLGSLSDGIWSITATATDQAGNTSAASAALSVRVDTQKPESAGQITATVTTGTSVSVNFTASDAGGLRTITASYSTSADLSAPASCGSVTSTSLTGTITCTIPATDGTYHVYTRATDNAGNVEDAPLTADDTIDRSSTAVTVDLAAASDTGSSSGDDLTSDDTPTIDVTGLSGAAAEVRAAKSGATDVTCSIAAGSAQCTLGSLAEGTWSVTATPSGGAASDALAIVVDRTAPTSTGTIAATLTNSRSVTVAYTAADANGLSGIEVRHTDAASAPWTTASCGSLVTSATSGSLSCTLDTANTTYHVHTLATDRAGNVEAKTAADDSIALDTVAPAAPAVGLAAASDSGYSATDDVTGDDTPEILVTGIDAGATASVTAAKTGTTSVACAVASGACTLGVLIDGAWSITATATDAAGNTSAPSASPLVATIDTVAPTSSGSITATITNGATATVAYTAGDGVALRTVTAYRSTAAGLTDPAACGSDTPAGVSGSIACALGAGDATYRVYTRATDAAGNVEDAPGTADDEIIRDSTAPAAPTVDLRAASDSGASNADDITNATGPTIDVGSIEAGAAAVVSAVKGATTVTCDVSGASCALSGLTDGVWTVTAKATDAAGNQSAASAVPVAMTVDTTAPVVSVASPAAGATVGRTPTVTGACTTGDGVVTVVFDPGTGPTAVTASCSGGSFAATVPAGSALAGGATDVTASQTDVAGNTDSTAPRSVTVDAVVPTVADVSATTADGTYAAGAVISVTVTMSESVTVTGTPVLVLETGAVDRSATYSAGSGTTTIAFSYTVQAGDASADLDYASSTSFSGGGVVDLSGNAATRTLPEPGTLHSLGYNKAIVIDTTAPAVTITAPTTGSTTNSATPTIEGACVTGDGPVGIVLTPASGSPTPLTATCTGSAYSATVPGGSPLADGSYAVVASQTDGAGNTGTSSTVTLAIDTTGPTVTTFTTTAPSPTGATSLPYRIVFSEPVTGLDVADLDLATGAGASTGWAVSAVSGSGTTWMATVVGTAPTGGTVTPRVLANVVQDAAGNSGPPGVSAGQQVVYDVSSTAGVAPIVTITSATTTPDGAEATFAFEASEPSTFECRVNGGSWEPCVSPRAYTGFAAGQHRFEVRAIDIEGMMSDPADRDWTRVTAPEGPAPASRSGAPKLEVDVFLPDVVQVNVEFTGDVTARNVGDAPAGAVRVSLGVPANAEVVEVRPLGGARSTKAGRSARAGEPCGIDGTTAICAAGSLVPSGSYRMEVDFIIRAMQTDFTAVGMAYNPETRARNVRRIRLAHVAPNGVRCTIMGSGLIRGTEGEDVICGSDQRDVVVGRGGDDVVYAGKGDDRVYAGTGDDRVLAGEGDDMVDAGEGDDVVKGHAGRDRILGRQGDDIIGGGRDADDIHAGLGVTRLMGVSPLDTHWFVIPGAAYPHWYVHGPSGMYIEHLVPAADVCRYAAC